MTQLSSETLLKAAKKYKTPLFIYNGDLILERYNDFFKFIRLKKMNSRKSNLRILYAMKANYNPEILKLLKKQGAWLDLVSPGEAVLALKLGFRKEHLLFTENNMTNEEMHKIRKLGILINIGSLSRLEKFGKTYPKSEVCIRFNPDVIAGEHEKVITGGDLTKFGILLSDLDQVKNIVKRYKLKVVGLHEHTGSGISDMNKVFQSIQNLMNIATRENFPKLKFLDFGGGFKVQYHPQEIRVNYAEFGLKVSRMFEKFCRKYGRTLDLYFEPGKYIVAESGYLIVEVNTLKKNKSRLIAGTNSGFNHLIRPVFYNAYHHITNLSNPDGKIRKYDIVGNICETGDTFASDRKIPEIREYDLLAIHNAGAYCYSMGSLYNLRPMPAEFLYANGNLKMVSKRMSEEELIEKIFKD